MPEPHTVYSRPNGWSRRGFWSAMLVAMAEAVWITETVALDATSVEAHRSAHGGQGSLGTGFGTSGGGQTTKDHILTDVLGRLVVVPARGHPLR